MELNNIIHIENYDKYKAFLLHNKNCIVKFTADWCGPCKKIAPLFKACSNDFPKIKFLEVDIDNATNITNYENVRSIPLFIFYNKGVKITDLDVGGANTLLFNKNMNTFNINYILEQTDIIQQTNMLKQSDKLQTNLILNNKPITNNNNDYAAKYDDTEEDTEEDTDDEDTNNTDDVEKTGELLNNIKVLYENNKVDVSEESDDSLFE